MSNKMSDCVESNDIRLLKLRRAGMFSNVNEVVEQLRLARKYGYRFVIDWSNSAYRDFEYPGDPWSYYFQPCFDGIERKELLLEQKLPVLPGGPEVACTRENIITPRTHDGICAPLLLPRDKLAANAIILEHIHLKEVVQKEIDAFEDAYFDKFVIGLHIRGPGRTHGGVPEMRKAFGSSDEVPFEPFFEAVERVISENQDAKILACSDSSVVIQAIKARFGNRVISWPALRSEFGEMHARHPRNLAEEFSGYRLGLDVVVEAYLLAKSSFLVHGNSNVTNFVLCVNPEIQNTYIQA